jgi:galactokinase
MVFIQDFFAKPFGIVYSRVRSEKKISSGMHVEKFSERFQDLYNMTPQVYRAPGRVNLIGEHTDHNEGFVMPMAIDFSTWVAIAPRAGRQIALRSENLVDAVEFDLDQPETHGAGHWSDYSRGVALVLERAGYRLHGAHLLVQSEVPIGSGLSSSAAIEVATGLALLDNSGLTVAGPELARLCQQAENEFVGIRCGLMDQFISCMGQTGKALLLDCRSLEYRLLPLPDEVSVVVCNTMVKHELASSAYNARRADCEAGVRFIAAVSPEVKSLRDVNIEALERFGPELSEQIYRRCRHVVTENARVLAAAAALERRDMTAFGEFMRESHRSLRDDYEVSCAELDLMADLGNETEGVYGARMMGGGFGGCTVNLVEKRSVEHFRARVASGYEEGTGQAPEIYVCEAAQGAERVQ